MCKERTVSMKPAVVKFMRLTNVHRETIVSLNTEVTMEHTFGILDRHQEINVSYIQNNNLITVTD